MLFCQTYVVIHTDPNSGNNSNPKLTNNSDPSPTNDYVQTDVTQASVNDSVQSYYRLGYGQPINARLSSPLLSHWLMHLRRAVDQHSSVTR